MIEITAAYLLLAADPTPPGQMEKLYYIVGSITFALSWLIPSIKNTLWGWLINGLKKALTDESVIKQQQALVNELKTTVDMIQAVQNNQTTIFGKLQSMNDQQTDIKKDLEEERRSIEKIKEAIPDLRERLAKIEGKIFK